LSDGKKAGDDDGGLYTMEIALIMWMAAFSARQPPQDKTLMRQKPLDKTLTIKFLLRSESWVKKGDEVKIAIFWPKLQIFVRISTKSGIFSAIKITKA